jgi:hypothetical protein
MAAYRHYVPLRAAQIVKLHDGTMCRMPSPRPGPLRGNLDVLTNEEKQDSLPPFSDRSEKVVKSTSSLAIGSAA